MPLVYDIAGRCVHLFDDGKLPKPRDRYDFGKAADLLFRPCDYDDQAEDCDVVDPHLYLDDRFFAPDDDGPSPKEALLAEREAWSRVLKIRDADEFTTHVSDFWRPKPRAGAKEFDDEPVNVEI